MARKATKSSSKKAQKLTWRERIEGRLFAWVLLVIILGLFYLSTTGGGVPGIGGILDGDDGGSVNSADYDGLYNPSAKLATLFSASVDYWEPAIMRWAQEFQLNPNLIATVVQIESCGHPYVVSPAGAQGIFQVMPLHFDSPGENQLDPYNNARRGLNHMKDCLTWSSDRDGDGFAESEPHVGLALACYNGGPGVIWYQEPSQWVQESRDYYTWGTGIWHDASRGYSQSQTLNTWLRSGGSILCDQAQTAQEQYDPMGYMFSNGY